MKVLQLISGRMDGGGQKVALDFCGELRQTDGVDAELGLLGCTVERLRGEAAFVVPYGGDYSSVFTLAGTALKLRRILQDRRYDVVHSHGWDADIIARWALGRSASVHVMHLHVTPAWTRSAALKQRVRRAMTQRSFESDTVRVIAVSDAVRRHWGEAFPGAAKAMRVVHNGVDVERFRPLRRQHEEAAADGVFVLGVACRLARMKGLPYLLEALRQVRDMHARSFRLDIAGEGSERPILESKVEDSGLSGLVRFLGPVAPARMPDFYRSLDAFVLPSVSDEGLPLVVLEAMACGLPVVATDVGGTKEAVRQGVDGWMVPPRDAGSLAEALLKVLDAPRRELQNVGANARDRACESFSLSGQAANVFDVYQQALRVRGGQSKRMVS
jgi:glycosyltransferase involved in cell wall biosynthesis